MKVVKKTMHYLKGTIYLRSIYSSFLKNNRDIQTANTFFLFKLIGYKNSNYTRDPKNKKSIIKY